MVNLIESIKSDPITYYIGLLVGVCLLCFIIFLIIRNDKKKKQRIQEMKEEKARIERHVDLETMIAQMQEQEQNKMKDVDPVANFEQEQEENAIISYQELVSAVKSEDKAPIEVTNVSSTGDILSTTQVPRLEVSEDKPIFIDEIKISKNDYYDIEQAEEPEAAPVSIGTELEKQIPYVQEVKENSSIVVEPKEDFSSIDTSKETPKFKNTEFISPIYGRQNSNVSYPKIASFHSDVEDSGEKIIRIADDVDPNVEFLKTLREYRNNE